ncbi:MAG: hypothetical protein QM811_02775 [Pirellulales bacterium]
MNTITRCIAFAYLILLIVGGRVQADPAQNEKAATPDAPVDVRAVLEKGKAAAALPKGLVVRIGACLGEADDDVPTEAKQLVESWELTTDEVHLVEHRTEAGKTVYARLASRPFDSRTICQDLLDGRALEIHERKGTGPEIVLAGTKYGRGSRSLEVVWNGRTILDLHETNGPTLDAYRETDARAFGKLYERLAAQARDQPARPTGDAAKPK